MLKMLFLVILSAFDVFDNHLKGRHIKIQLFVLCRPQLFSVSHRILSSPSGQLCFHYFHFFLTHLDIIS